MELVRFFDTLLDLIRDAVNGVLLFFNGFDILGYHINPLMIISSSFLLFLIPIAITKWAIS